jgi:hypothetical protein
MRKLITMLAFSFALAACAQMTGQPQSVPGRTPEAKDFSLVGYNDLKLGPPIARHSPPGQPLHRIYWSSRRRGSKSLVRQG